MGKPVDSAATSLHFSITIPAMVEITGDPLNTIAKQEGNSGVDQAEIII
jgi:hypothetical protein